MAIIWPCPLPPSSYAAAGRQVATPVQACPSCRSPLTGWGGYWRWVRPEHGPEQRIWIHRGWCTECRRTQALLPSFLFVHWLDDDTVIGEALTFGGWFAPGLVLSRRRNRRLAAIEKQLPEALTAMAKSLRAGSGILQALEYAAAETPSPLGPELAAVMRDLQLGADAEELFRGLSERVGSPDLDIAVTGIVIQRTVGGNLSEVLNQVTATIRERAELQSEIRALTAQQRLSANFAAALPVFVAVVVTLMRPEIGTAGGPSV
jgi:Flp pilus assembly protein TadB